MPALRFFFIQRFALPPGRTENHPAKGEKTVQYHYKVKDLMTANPVVIDQNSSLKEAAERMILVNCGIMPVGTPEQLVGMITDRDITVRAVARGKDPLRTKVSEVMTHKVFFVNENATLNQALDAMKKQNINRLVVKDIRGRVTGIFSLSGMIRENADLPALSGFIQRLADKMFQKAA